MAIATREGAERISKLAPLKSVKAPTTLQVLYTIQGSASRRTQQWPRQHHIPIRGLLGTWRPIRRSCSSFLTSLSVPTRGVVTSQDPGSRNVRAQETGGLERAAFLDWRALA